MVFITLKIAIPLIHILSLKSPNIAYTLSLIKRQFKPLIFGFLLYPTPLNIQWATHPLYPPPLIREGEEKERGASAHLRYLILI